MKAGEQEAQICLVFYMLSFKLGGQKKKKSIGPLVPAVFILQVHFSSETNAGCNLRINTCA